MAGTFRISGLVGSLQIGGTSNVIFATSLEIMNVSGTVSLGGVGSVKAFNNVSLFSCPDVRIDPGWDDETHIGGTLEILSSNVVLNGQGNARHNYSRTNINSGSRLDITGTLGAGSVNLDTSGTPGAREGWIIDRRPGWPLETYLRREAAQPLFPPDALYEVPGTWVYYPPISGRYNLFAAGGGGGGANITVAPYPMSQAGGGGGGIGRRIVQLTAGVPLTVEVGAGGVVGQAGGATTISDGGVQAVGHGGQIDAVIGGAGGTFVGEAGINGAAGSPTAGGAPQILYGSNLTGTVSLMGSYGGPPTNSGSAGRALITYVGG